MRITDDKILHAVVGFFVAMVVSTIVANTGSNALGACLSGLLGGLACGVGKEYGDSKAEGNAWSWGDILFDFVGSAIGCLFGLTALLI